VLTQEENDLLTKIGPGTACGDLFRRYWHPIAAAADLTREKPRERVRVLGEDLVLFWFADQDRYVLLAEQCRHRGASLYYGYQEESCTVRCAYHGWKYDAEGRCLEQPFEPPGSHYNEKVRQPAYKVERYRGLVFAYMGPEPAPLIPRWDVTARTDGTRKIVIHPVLRCNWLQAQENSVDTVHTYYLHGVMMRSKGLPGGEYYLRPIERYEYVSNEWGITKKRYYGGEQAEAERGHPAVFPNMLRVPEHRWQAFHWRLPIDDESTQIFWMGFLPDDDGREIAQRDSDIPVEHLRSLKTAEDEHEMTSFQSQDKMAWETQGARYDRTKEHLSASDRGITMWRKMLREQIEIVRAGGRPMALVTDPAQNECISFDISAGQAREEYQVRKRDALPGGVA